MPGRLSCRTGAADRAASLCTRCARSIHAHEPGLKLPSDAELDKMVAFLEKVWRRLMEMGRTERKVEGRY
jgi:hypothetical protein